MDTIATLIEEKAQITKRLEKLLHGSIEIREKSSGKYIYTHFRSDGVPVTKYAGEYSNELYNLILENNILAKDLKKRLRSINKQLKDTNYVETELSETVELNRALAYRNLVDSIYKQAMLEGVATTYSDTETIVNGGKVSGMSADDISKVVNLKHAWEFILNKGVLQYPSNYSLLCQINSLVEAGFSVTAGKLRSVPVTIGGSTYIPPLPIESQVQEQLTDILKKDDCIDRAVSALIYVMKKQLFLDGNKRTAVIFANHILISSGKGLIVIPAEMVSEYKKLLIEYYEGKPDSENNIKAFLIEKALLRL